MTQQPPDDRYRLARAAALGAADGVAAGWAFVLLLLQLDIGGIGTLVHASPQGWLALIILLLAFGTTFSLVGLGWRIMVLLPRDE